jgi:hypothetical protein
MELLAAEDNNMDIINQFKLLLSSKEDEIIKA